MPSSAVQQQRSHLFGFLVIRSCVPPYSPLFYIVIEASCLFECCAASDRVSAAPFCIVANFITSKSDMQKICPAACNLFLLAPLLLVTSFRIAVNCIPLSSSTAVGRISPRTCLTMWHPPALGSSQCDAAVCGCPIFPFLLS